ncbi:MAG: hypothetical protein AAFV53_37465 [Myxococcota bacterium]
MTATLTVNTIQLLRSPRQIAETLYEDERVIIRYTPGTSPRGVCVFADLPEMWGGAGDSGLADAVWTAAGSMHRFEIIDRRGTWFNECFNTVYAVLKSACTRNDIHSLMMLGEGMGGYGAMLFLDALPRAHRGAAFNLPSSVHPDRVSFEHRWSPLRQRIKRWAAPCLTERWSRKELYLFFGSEAQEDTLHADRLQPLLGDGQMLYHLEGYGADLIRDIQARGQLAATLEALFARSSVDARLSAAFEADLVTEEHFDDMITEQFAAVSMKAAK